MSYLLYSVRTLEENTHRTVELEQAVTHLSHQSDSHTRTIADLQRNNHETTQHLRRALKENLEYDHFLQCSLPLSVIFHMLVCVD
jgi:hypothetical protein